MMSTGSRFTNKLSNEKSPYLLQHQHNPIEWYPWGPEAFQKAKELNRPIFLSDINRGGNLVGYSTCHWCHVMEKESFENEQIAQYLNEHFVSIKVDREERPDVDKLYMSFIQAMSGAGGWPMTVFLTPDLDPITGGTYFPPHDSPGSMGLPSVLRLVTENWSDKRTREAMGGQGKMITDALRKGSVYTHGDAPPLDPVLTGAFKYKVSNFDEKFGGFGNAPKFPKACDLEFLIYHFCWTKIDSERELCRHMLDVTLDAMSRGGIHDHIGKGFHRYSVDEEWHVPHFEKMLYDQAQLLGVYADACHVCGDKYKHVVEDIAQYMDDCLSHEDSKFWDTETESGYFIGSEQGDVKVRVMEDQDGAEPCANSVAVGNLIRLYDYFEDTECKRKAEKIVAASSSRLIKYPFILTKMISGYHRMVKGSTEIMVVGKATDEKVGAFLKEIQSYNIWNKLLLLLDPSVDNSYITERSPTYAEMLKSNEPTVFICSNFACGAPLTSLDELKSQLKELAS
ncbi:hypothetical protein ANCCEY_13976 [Ancylostoma ceylanicum]|uniref:Spermatogenesis-associated protein 20-like TRX domain-containing protein n=1 Tax=Ancylostoma ceylanicum TaxID=53326 RepID=A0A0D6L5X0_9BILA|nr:hypothetical protein ANCCEY_13976 [Ancylostoma ceylanicum]